MKFIAKLIFMSAFVASPLAALACSDPVVPTFAEDLRRAKNVFVFRVVSLELADHAQRSSDLRGSIKVVHTLKGNAPITAKIAYASNACCAIKLHVGRYYMAALDDDRATLELVPGDQSILDVTDDFASRGGAGKDGAIEPVKDYLSGKPLPIGFPGSYRLESTISCPAIPPGT